ncbi:unnamed protein product [Phytophthora fragariaefolia]|uniref:Unnamed protein product n=1 Tax=Phytophthora fragariaefolia TaxID=1490495 RepID=A0A9W6UF92_9STRA|nr:unnamed protein product [Phytophthora fragariaefolia]
MGKSSVNTGTVPFDNSRSHEHKPRIAGPPGMTTETQMILRVAPYALGAGPAEHDVDAPSLSETEEKLPTPPFKKHSGGPGATKGASASKKHGNDMNDEKKTPAPEKPTTDEKTPASTKPTRKTTASSKPAPKQPAVKKPAAKQLPKKNTTKETRRTTRLPPKRTDVMLPGPHEEVSSDSSDTDTPNPALVTGAGLPVGDASQAPRAQTSTTGPAASANSATMPPPKRSPSPDPSLRVDYEESESDMDCEAGDVEGSWSSPPLTDEQRVLHPASPISPKTVVAIARARVLEEALSRRDDPPPATPKSQVITQAGVDEGVPPELLRPTEFEGWWHHLGYPEPEFLNSPFWIDWLAQRRLRFRMAKMIADDTWTGRFLVRHKPMPGVILEEVLQKIQKSWQSQPIEPRSVLGPVSADQVRGRSQKRPRGRRSPLRGEPQAPMSFDYSGSHATSPGTGTDRYAHGASIASRHGNRGRPRYQAEAEEPATGVVSDQDAQRQPTGSRPDLESLLAGLDGHHPTAGWSAG